MARQAPIFTSTGVQILNETQNAQVGLPGIIMAETASGTNAQIVSVTAAGSVHVSRGSGKLVGMVVAGAVSLLKGVGKIVETVAAITVAAGAAFVASSTGVTITVNPSAAVHLSRSMGKLILPASALAVTLKRNIGHLVGPITTAIGMSLSAGNFHTKTIAVAVSASVGFGKMVTTKLVSVASAIAVAMTCIPTFLGASDVNHTQAVLTTCAVAVTVLHSRAMRVVAGCSSAVTLKCRSGYARLVAVAIACVVKPAYHSAKTLQATGGVSISMPPIWKQVFKRFPSLPVGSVVLTSRMAGKPITPSVSTSVSMVRAMGKIVVALPAILGGGAKHCTHALRWAVSIAVSAGPGSGHLQALAVAVSTRVTIFPARAYLRLVALAPHIVVTILQPKTVAALVLTTCSSMVSISRGIGKSVLSVMALRVVVSTSPLRVAVSGTVAVTWRQGRRDILKGWSV